MLPQKIVVRYADGKVLKGTTRNFNPQASNFALVPADAPPNEKGIAVEVASLKAVFFVRDFTGDPAKKDREGFVPGGPYRGHRVEVLFKDGERLPGYTPNYDRSLTGFFVFPADPASNTIKAFVVTQSIQDVRVL